jgi:hypothetical protein
MKIIELLKEYMDSKTKCFINGMPEEDGGLIKVIEEDYIVFDIENKNEKPELITTEKVIVPISKINMIGLVPKKKIDIANI